jgi:hypothetical protein
MRYDEGEQQRWEEGRQEWAAEVASREAERVPTIKAALINVFTTTYVSCSEHREFRERVVAYIDALPATDLRFRLLADFVDLDVPQVLDMYIIAVDEDDYGWTAERRYRSEFEDWRNRDPGELVTLVLLDALAFIAADPMPMAS